MRYFEKGTKMGLVTLQETEVWTETEYVVRTIMAWIIFIFIVLFLVGLFIGGPIMLIVCMYWDYLAMQAAN